MGGRIWIESEEGHGSTFHFTVRMGIADPAAGPALSPANLAGLRVLVVDDNATNRRILEERLTRWGCSRPSAKAGPNAEAASTEAAPANDAVSAEVFHAPVFNAETALECEGPALERAAHFLKGAAANISAEEVRTAARVLEDAAREKNWKAAGAKRSSATEFIPWATAERHIRE